MAAVSALETNLNPVLNLSGAVFVVGAQALVANAVVDASSGIAVADVENDGAVLCGALGTGKQCASGVGDEALCVALAAERRWSVNFVDGCDTAVSATCGGDDRGKALGGVVYPKLPSLDHGLGLPTTVGQREREINGVVCEFFAQLGAFVEVGRGSEAHRVTRDECRGRLDRLYSAEGELCCVKRLGLRDLSGSLCPQVGKCCDDGILAW